MGSVPHVSCRPWPQGYEHIKGMLKMKIDITGTGDTQDINLFSDVVKPRGAPPPGLPQFNPNRVVSHPRDS
jgi:hypothetical protein